MSFIADFHIHSHWSRATSKECTLEGLHYWAQLKGVRLVGTGDFTHPAWSAELAEALVESGPGLYRLRPELADPVNDRVPGTCRSPVDFMLTGEISSIYKRAGRVRKVHSMLVVPDLDTAVKINARLDALGNIKSDGRPILGLDPRDLLEIALEANPEACLIPAHIWTPWFSMLGSKSGFDSPKECFGDLEQHIFAAETGLSSDPPMNWRVSCLDQLALISNSDLHSPKNLARNANIFHCEPDYYRILDGLRRRDPSICGGTIDLFPEEGKYHLDGHRKCGVCMEPEESLAHDCLCPACGKPLVLGVLHRVVELADRPTGGRPEGALPCQYIVPLAEILAEIHHCGAAAKKVTAAYHRLLDQFGPEMRILRETDIGELTDADPTLLCDALQRLREGKVIRHAGFDGEYGVIKLFDTGDEDRLRRQGVFFTQPTEPGSAHRPHPRAIAQPGDTASSPEQVQGREYRLSRSSAADGRADQPELADHPGAPSAKGSSGQLSLFEAHTSLDGLTDVQERAAMTVDAPVIIVAGPGTGKTRTLTHRIAHLVNQRLADPTSVLAITFTNRAADEMRERLQQLLRHAAGDVTVSTFHALGVRLLRQFHEAAGLPLDFTLLDQEDEKAMLRELAQMGAREATAAVEAISEAWRELREPADIPGFSALERALTDRAALALDAIVPRCVKLLRAHSDVVAQLRWDWLCVDEYQDINRAQYELVKLLCRDERRLCVIGDPDQAIYGFRGADVSYFLRFTGDFPTAKSFGLESNFRSSGTIVTAAARVIAPGQSDMSVSAESAFSAGLQVRFHEAPSAAAEAEFISHEIEKWLGGTALFSVDSARVDGTAEGAAVSLADIAVLVRLRAVAGPIAEALSRLGLPVQLIGEDAFIDQPGARAVINELRRAPEDVQNAPASRVLAASLREAMAAGRCAGTGMAALEECARLASAYPGILREFLNHLLLRQGPDRYDSAAERITVMSLHAAKGLEFPIVFIAACEDGILPYVKPDEEPDIAEERRLLYVGMTRAREVLYITSSGRRTLFGQAEPRRPSPFVRDIEEALRDRFERAPQRREPSAAQLEFDLG